MPPCCLGWSAHHPRWTANSSPACGPPVKRAVKVSLCHTHTQMCNYVHGLPVFESVMVTTPAATSAYAVGRALGFETSYTNLECLKLSMWTFGQADDTDCNHSQDCTLVQYRPLAQLLRLTSPVFSMKFIAPAHTIYCSEGSVVSTPGPINLKVHVSIADSPHPTSVALTDTPSACFAVSIR